MNLEVKKCKLKEEIRYKFTLNTGDKIMSFKKRATKSIALALMGVTIATPILNTASAMENSNYGLSNDKIIELKKYQKKYFQ